MNIKIEKYDMLTLTEDTLVYLGKFLERQTYGSVQCVCKRWSNAFKSFNPYGELLPFQILFTPIFKRYVISLSQIDITGALKFEERVSKVGCGRIPVVQNIIREISQGGYEAKMFYNAFKSATVGYSFAEFRSNLNDFFNSPEKNLLLQAADFLAEHYYQSALPKLTICPRLGNKMPAESSELAILTQEELLQKAKEFESDPNLFNAFSTLRRLIIENNLLPIEDRKVLAVAKVAGSESEKFAVLMIAFVCFVAYVLLLWNVPNPPWGRS